MNGGAAIERPFVGALIRIGIGIESIDLVTFLLGCYILIEGVVVLIKIQEH